MRIAYIGGAYIPGRGADSVHQMNMCAALAALGHEVTLHARAGPESSLSDHDFYGVPPAFKVLKHRRPQVKVLGALVNAAFVGHGVHRQRPDLVYAREVYGLAASAAQGGVPFVFESHWNPKHRVQHELEAWLFRRPNFQRVILISDALRSIYRKRFPWLREDQMVVAHDAANPRPLTARTSTAGRMQIGYVGGFLRGYGLEVVAELARRHTDADFHVFGGAEGQVTDWRTRTRDVRNLTWHGFVQPSKLADVYASLDVALAPYQRSTAHIDWISPMKLFEYMAFGKAILCSDFPVMREILRNEVDGLLVSPQDFGGWSAAIRRLAEPSLRARLGASAHSRLEREFTWKTRAERVLERAMLNPGNAP